MFSWLCEIILTVLFNKVFEERLLEVLVVRGDLVETNGRVRHIHRRVNTKGMKEGIEVGESK